MDRPGAARAAAAPPALGLRVPLVAGLRVRARSVAVALTRAGAALGARRRLGYSLIALVMLVALLGGGFLWLRQSSFAAVRTVQISGVRGPQSAAIDAALSAAARRMSTLDVHTGELQAAVAPFALVQAVHARASFPHTLHIRVVEQSPVAVLQSDGERTAVAADGVVLGPAPLTGAQLPALSAGFAPAAGQRVREASLREVLTVLGAIPAPLQRFVVRASTGAKGIEVVMRSRLVAYFGDSSRPHAKWLALATVLASERAAGASYIDVRVPERPAAGYASGAAPAPATQSGTASAGASGAGAASTPESSAAAIAARLAAAVGSGEAPSEQHQAGEEEEAGHGATGEAGAPRTAPGAAPGSSAQGASEAGASGASSGSPATPGSEGGA